MSFIIKRTSSVKTERGVRNSLAIGGGGGSCAAEGSTFTAITRTPMNATAAATFFRVIRYSLQVLSFNARIRAGSHGASRGATLESIRHSSYLVSAVATLSASDSERMLRFVAEAESVGGDYAFTPDLLVEVGMLIAADWVTYAELDRVRKRDLFYA